MTFFTSIDKHPILYITYTCVFHYSETMDHHLDICLNELKKSTLCHRHGAMVIYRNKVVASHNYLRTNNHRKSIHAEVAAIQKFMVHHPRRFLHEAVLFVIRVNRSGQVCNSKPCPACQKYIIKHGIPVTYYSS